MFLPVVTLGLGVIGSLILYPEKKADIVLGPYWVRFDPSRAEDRLDPHRLEGLFNPDTFSKMFPDVTTEDIPPFFAGTCCSQFALSREAIQRHSKQYYINLRDWTMDWDNNDEESG